MPSALPTGRAAMTVDRGAPTAAGIAAAHERALCGARSGASRRRGPLGDQRRSATTIPYGDVAARNASPSLRSGFSTRYFTVSVPDMPAAR